MGVSPVVGRPELGGQTWIGRRTVRITVLWHVRYSVRERAPHQPHTSAGSARTRGLEGLRLYRDVESAEHADTAMAR
jgi:hypothetical protein